MSKRGSTNAIRFAGKSYSFGKSKLKSAVVKAFSKKKNKKIKKTNKQKQFDEVCDKFNFKREGNEKLFLKLFLEFKNIKKFRERIQVIENIKYFDLYSVENKIPFTIDNYISLKYYRTDYKSLYPNLFEINHKRKSKKKDKKIIFSTNKLKDFFPISVIKKLKQDK